MCMNLASTSQAKHYFNTGKFVQSVKEPEHDKQWWLKQVKETVGYSADIVWSMIYDNKEIKNDYYILTFFME